MGDDMADTVLTIDARGEACPIPVVRTLKTLAALAAEHARKGPPLASHSNPPLRAR